MQDRTVTHARRYNDLFFRHAHVQVVVKHPDLPGGSPGHQLWDTAKTQNHKPLNSPQIRQLVIKTTAGRGAVRRHLFPSTHGSGARTVPEHTRLWLDTSPRAASEESRQQVSWSREFLFFFFLFSFVFIPAYKATHTHAREDRKAICRQKLISVCEIRKQPLWCMVITPPSLPPTCIITRTYSHD